MTYGESNTTRNAKVTALSNLLDGGFIKFYNGVKPATPNTAIGAQVLLASITFQTPSFGSPSAGVATAQGLPLSTTAVASGTCTWGRLWKSDNATPLGDFDVGTSGQDINFDSVAFVVGGTVQLTSLTITQPQLRKPGFTWECPMTHENGNGDDHETLPSIPPPTPTLKEQIAVLLEWQEEEQRDHRALNLRQDVIEKKLDTIIERQEKQQKILEDIANHGLAVTKRLDAFIVEVSEKDTSVLVDLSQLKSKQKEHSTEIVHLRRQDSIHDIRDSIQDAQLMEQRSMLQNAWKGAKGAMTWKNAFTSLIVGVVAVVAKYADEIVVPIIRAIIKGGFG